MLHCEINSNLKEYFITECSIENTDFNIIDYDKINILLNPSTPPRQVEKLGSFIKHSLELRTGDS